jgi:hypothetical protein
VISDSIGDCLNGDPSQAFIVILREQCAVTLEPLSSLVAELPNKIDLDRSRCLALSIDRRLDPTDRSYQRVQINHHVSQPRELKLFVNDVAPMGSDERLGTLVQVSGVALKVVEATRQRLGHVDIGAAAPDDVTYFMKSELGQHTDLFDRLAQCATDVLQVVGQPLHPGQRDKRAQHLVCTLEDRHDPRVAKEPLERTIVDVAPSTGDLDRRIGRSPRSIRRIHFADRGFKAVIDIVAIDQISRQMYHRFSDKDVEANLSDLAADQIVFRDPATKLTASASEIDRGAEDCAHRSDRTGCQSQTPTVEDVHRHLEAVAGLVKHPVVAQLEVPKQKLGLSRRSDS